MRIEFLLIAIIFLSMCTQKEEEKMVRTRPVKHMVVQKSGVNDRHTFSGSAQSKEEAKLSFRVAGTISNIRVKVGDLIKKGQIIARIEPTDYKVSLQQALAQERGAQATEHSSETQIKSAEANFIAVRSAYQRVTKLYENNSVSLSEFEQTKANYEAALANYEAAKSQYEAAKYNTTASQGSKNAAQNQVDYTRLIAPFNGVISQQLVEENELVNSGTPIVTLSSLGKPEVVVGVPEVLISKVKKGMKTFVSFSTLPGRSFEASVIEVGYSPGSGSTYPVTTNLLSTDAAIRPGMPASVTFDFKLPTELSQKLLVPAASVGEDSDGRFVFKLERTENGRAIARRQSVKVGKLRNQGFEIIQGLKEGDIIAAAGLNILLDGDEVRL